mgnify:FL=1
MLFRSEYQPNRKRKRSLFHSTVDGHWVDVFFDRSEFNGTLHITFTVDGNYDTPTMPTKASKSIFKILSTVLDIVKKQLPEYMQKARPPALSFTAKEDNRAGLYRKYFVPVIQNILGDKWQLEEYPNMGMTVFNWKPKKKAVTEISTDTLQRYLGKADRHISRRLDHMSRARERLNKNYEIYDADLPGHPIVDRFEADTPAQAREYYYNYIKNYVSDRDYTLELRRGTGLLEDKKPSDTLYFFDVEKGGKSFHHLDLKIMGLKQSLKGKWYYQPGRDSSDLLVNSTLKHLEKVLNVPARPWHRPDRTGVTESNEIKSAKDIVKYINSIHPEALTKQIEDVVLSYPKWKLETVNLHDLHIPDQDYDDPDQEPEEDPYNRVMVVDPYHAGEVSSQYIDKRPIVIDHRGFILDGNHRAWAAAELYGKDTIRAWVPE